MKIYEFIHLLKSVASQNLDIKGLVADMPSSLNILSTARGDIPNNEGYIYFASLHMENELLQRRPQTCSTLLPQMETYIYPDDETTNGESEVYLSYVEEYPKDNFISKYFPIISYEIKENILYLIGGEEDLSARTEFQDDETLEAFKVITIRPHLMSFDSNLPLVVYTDKREPHYFWEIEEDEVEYYNYCQTQIIPQEYYYQSYPVHTLCLRDGEVMFTHQTYTNKVGLTVGEALIQLDNFSDDEYVGLNIEIDNGDGTAMPHYFSVWAIELKDEHCVLIANVNHEGLLDTRIVEIIK